MRIASPAIPTGLPANPRSERAAADAPSGRIETIEPVGGGSRRADSSPGYYLSFLRQDGDDLQSVPARNRAAVSAYIANQPSTVERLGVELVGIDEFA